MKKLLVALALLAISAGPALAKGQVITKYKTKVIAIDGVQIRAFAQKETDLIEVRMIWLGGAFDGFMLLTKENAAELLKELLESKKLDNLSTGNGDVYVYQATISDDLGFKYEIDKSNRSSQYFIYGKYTGSDSLLTLPSKSVALSSHAADGLVEILKSAIAILNS